MTAVKARHREPAQQASRWSCVWRGNKWRPVRGLTCTFLLEAIYCEACIAFLRRSASYPCLTRFRKFLPRAPTALCICLTLTRIFSCTRVFPARSRAARRAGSHMFTTPPLFVSTIGTVTCRHGASRRSLIKKERSVIESKRLPGCGCKLGPLSMHGGLKGLQLGKFCKLKVPA